jgi:hypothetical protein
VNQRHTPFWEVESCPPANNSRQLSVSSSRLFDSGSGKDLRTLGEAMEGSFAEAAFSPDGKVLAEVCRRRSEALNRPALPRISAPCAGSARHQVIISSHAGVRPGGHTKLASK